MTVDEFELMWKEGEYEIGSLEDLEESDRLIIEVNDREIAIFHKNNEYFAVANYCPHQAGSLCEGPVTGQITVNDEMNWQFNDEQKLVTCSWHYWKFDIKTGKNTKDG